MRLPAWTGLVLAAALIAVGAGAAPLSQEQALAALEHVDTDQRLEAVAQLAASGKMPDAHRLLARLTDSDPRVRAAANAAIWQIWSRSGDAATDRLFARGIEQMEAGALPQALAAFDAIVDAYMLCSVCADLRISSIVDVPNWVVSFYFPRVVLE